MIAVVYLKFSSSNKCFVLIFLFNLYFLFFKYVKEMFLNSIKNYKGKYILNGDSNDSYNFEDLPIFYNKI